jgi:monoamine oxidase
MHRSRFVRGSLGAAAALVLSPAYTTATSFAAGRERVAIVGAGIAGLTCATILRDAGVSATIYESSQRVGGRMHSEFNYWNEGQHTEWCGSMMDSKHLTMHALAKRFDQPLVDTWATLGDDARDTAFLSGRLYRLKVADNDFEPVFNTIQTQLVKLGHEPRWDSSTPFARELDALSMAGWIDKYVPGGRGSQLGKLIDIALSNEYGGSTESLSSLNLVYMLGFQERYGMRGGEMNVLGYSDQRYTTLHGNQRIPAAMAAGLPNGSIHFGHRLTAIRRRAGGDYELTVTTPKGTEKFVYDRVILTVPFAILRGIDYGSAGFDARKQNAIEHLGYGIHTKLQMQFTQRAWMIEPGPWTHPSTGQIWTDTGFQNSVDYSLGQPGKSGIIEAFTYGTAGLLGGPPVPYSTIEQQPQVRELVKRFFGQLDRIWPGVSKYWNGKASYGNAQADPNITISYSYWGVGQYTTIAGYEGVRQGRIHFAGEHTSYEHQGFMEGGAASGVRAANEVLADYGIAAKNL